MTFRTKTILGTCAAMLLGFGSLAAQEKGAAPAPMPAPKATPAAPSFHYDAACCDTCCNHGDGGCYALVEAVFLWPNSNDLTAFTIYRNDFEALEQRNFDPDVEITPRITVGWKNCDGLGFRVRYWRFNTKLDESVFVDGDNINFASRNVDLNDEIDFSVSAGFGDSLVAKTELRLWTLDFEVTKDVEVCGSELTLGAGIRYANTRSILKVAEVFEGFVEDGYQIEHKFRAIGPTVSAEARAPVCGLTAVVGLRTSIMITFVDREFTIEDTNGNTFKDDGDTGLWISEIFLGLEKSCETCYGNISFRAGYEAQYWANASLASRVGEGETHHGSPLFLDGFSFGIGISR